MRVDNAIIMAAGTASRFAPISYEKPKALITVKGEVLIERQIRQLKEAGIHEIIVVTGYKAEQFEYLRKKLGVTLVHNPEYLTKNNHSSIYAVKDYLKNSYICSSDNYFLQNPFENEVENSFYSCVFAKGKTQEWCISEKNGWIENVVVGGEDSWVMLGHVFWSKSNSFYSCVFAKGKTQEWCISEKNGWIENVVVGGEDSWVMLGHVFWSKSFSRKFISILEEEYTRPETANKLWETIYIEHITELPLSIRKYPDDYIFEFDTLDELREFDLTYWNNSGSNILKKCADALGIEEKDLTQIKAFKDKDNAAAGFSFFAGRNYKYYYKTNQMEEIS